MSLSYSTLLKVLALPTIGRKHVFHAIQALMKANQKLTDQELYELVSDFTKGRSRFQTAEQKKQWLINIENILELSNKADIKMVHYFEDAYPQALKKTPDAPILFHYRGNLAVLNQKPNITIIGTRQPTSYGKQAATLLAKQYAKENYNIVSGLALGCDSAAHQGALNANGTTTALLAHGLQTIQPPSNKHLAEEIVAKDGLLLSEYPYGKKPHRSAFIERDRLQAGLSETTILIESTLTGGSLHAMAAAKQYGRNTLVLKHPAEWHNEDATKGNQRLIEEGAKTIDLEN